MSITMCENMKENYDILVNAIFQTGDLTSRAIAMVALERLVSEIEALKDGYKVALELVETARKAKEETEENLRRRNAETTKLKSALTAAKPIPCRECKHRTKGCTSRVYFYTRLGQDNAYRNVDHCSNAEREEAK